MNKISSQHDIGNYYGYPKCCIKDFEKILQRPNNLQCKISKHSGFIPCMICCQLIIKDKIKIEDLIQNRICKIPFPNGTGGKKYIHNLK